MSDLSDKLHGTMKKRLTISVEIPENADPLEYKKAVEAKGNIVLRVDIAARRLILMQQDLVLTRENAP